MSDDIELTIGTNLEPVTIVAGAAPTKVTLDCGCEVTLELPVGVVRQDIPLTTIVRLCDGHGARLPLVASVSGAQVRMSVEDDGGGMSDWVDGWPESTDYVGPRVVRRDEDGIRWEWDDPPAKWRNPPNFVEVYLANDGSLNLECGQDEHEMGGFVELTPELARSIAAELIRLADTPTRTVVDTPPPV